MQYLIHHTNGTWDNPPMVEMCRMAFGAPGIVMADAGGRTSGGTLELYDIKIDSTGQGQSPCIYGDSSTYRVWIEIRDSQRRSLITEQVDDSGCRSESADPDTPDYATECLVGDYRVWVWGTHRGSDDTNLAGAQKVGVDQLATKYRALLERAIKN